MESALRIFAQGTFYIVLLVNHFRETRASNNTPYAKKLFKRLVSKELQDKR